MATIIYCLIGNENSSTPLGEISLASGNFALMAVKLLEKFKGEADFSKSYAYDNEYMFHFHNKNGISVLCMTSAQYSNRLAYSFLFEVRDKVLEAYGNEIKKMIAFGIQKPFMNSIKDLMKEYNSEREDKILTVKKNVDEVKEIMVHNLEKILERGEKIEVLVNKTELLKDNAVVFSKSAKAVKVHFLCKNIKLTIAVSLILMLVLAAIVILSCGGFELSNCR